MGQLPSILKESKNPDSPLHIGGIGNFMQPLCEKFAENEMDILGWITTREQKIPRETVCSECFELYEKGLAWRYKSQIK